MALKHVNAISGLCLLVISRCYRWDVQKKGIVSRDPRLPHYKIRCSVWLPEAERWPAVYDSLVQDQSPGWEAFKWPSLWCRVIRHQPHTPHLFDLHQHWLFDAGDKQCKYLTDNRVTSDEGRILLMHKVPALSICLLVQHEL